MQQNANDRTESRHWETRLRIPKVNDSLDQHEEYCEVLVDGDWARVRMHDYDTIYNQPGLYEALFYEKLKCDSPKRVVGLLDEVRKDHGVLQLRALDVGAGNGLVGEALKQAGASTVYGVDILPEAKSAAERDRPSVYTRYLLADLCNLKPDEITTLEGGRFNCMTCVAALGFGDIPHRAFINAVNSVENGGLIAFNIKESFLDEAYNFGFSKLIRKLSSEKLLRFEATRRYRHRLSSQGEPLHYLAIVATKMGNIPDEMAND